MQLLRNLIIESIKEKGKITFAEFMRTVLYHPQYGYYNSDKERIGKFGDYFTSPTVHRIFGELIAKQMEEMWQIMGGGAFTVVEMGANRGWLCHDIIHTIMKKYPRLYDNFNYIIVESNPYAKKKQKALLNFFITDNPNRAQEATENKNYFNQTIVQHSIASFCTEEEVTHSTSFLSDGKDLRGKVSWHSYTDDGFSFDKIQGCFLSNEFVDALPVHRLRLKNRVLKEVYVGYNGGKFCEIDDEVSVPALRDYLETNKIYLTEGQCCEVNLGAAEWLRHASEKLEKGFIITIDYGDTSSGLYDEGNTDGTVRCYHRHSVNRDYYERLGEQDITAHVDFTNLINTGKTIGLAVTGFARQSHYLIALGILERLNNINNDVETRLKLKNLFHPEGMGEVFKVLIQHKNIKNPQLTGFRPLHTVTV